MSVASRLSRMVPSFSLRNAPAQPVLLPLQERIRQRSPTITTQTNMKRCSAPARTYSALHSSICNASEGGKRFTPSKLPEGPGQHEYHEPVKDYEQQRPWRALQPGPARPRHPPFADG